MKELNTSIVQSPQKENKGIYINGKQQVIDLLKAMDVNDKSKLLQNLKLRSPALAKELSENSFSYESIWQLQDDSLRRIMMTTKPVILGLALYLATKSQQRRVLSLLPQELAVKAFEVMTKDLSRHRKECLRAQDKIVENALDLSQRKIVQFY
jgi:flagellar motor switch protein FliG